MVACQRLGCDVTGFLHFEAERRGRYGGETEGVGGVVDGGVREWEGGSMVLSCPVGANDASDGKSRPSFRMDLRKNLEKRVYYVHLPTHWTIMTTS